MKKIALISLLTCAVLFSTAQVNFVKNPSFEEYYNCPDDNNKLSYAKHWHSPVDTIGVHNFAPEYLNTCATLINVGVPENIGGFQYPRTGNAYIGGLWYYDTPPPPRLLLYRPIGGIMHKGICINPCKQAKFIALVFG